MPNSRGPRCQRIIHTCTVMFLFIVCDTFSGIASLNVRCRLQRPHNNIHPLFAPFALRFFSPPSARRGCSIRSRCLRGGGDARACALPAVQQIQGASYDDHRSSEGRAARARRTPKFARSGPRQRPCDDRSTVSRLEMSEKYASVRAAN